MCVCVCVFQNNNPKNITKDIIILKNSLRFLCSSFLAHQDVYPKSKYFQLCRPYSVQSPVQLLNSAIIAQRQPHRQNVNQWACCIPIKFYLQRQAVS